MAPDPVSQSPFKFVDGQRLEDVHASRAELAGRIDRDRNRLLTDTEIRDYLVETGDLDPGGPEVYDEARLLQEFKLSLSARQNPAAAGYHSYEQLVADMRGLAERFPDLATMVSLGRTHEGRDVWALRIGNDLVSAPGDRAGKPGIVLTGAHHAREWMSMEAPLHVAHRLLEGYATDPEMQRRVDRANLWIVPLANPDGYEYSRNEDGWWRKNRRPITRTACDDGDGRVRAHGVDLNRNYDDGTPDHAYLYRPPGDTPCSTRDDFGWATSDNPRSDTYRGPAGASEKEVQALLALELDPANKVVGVIDHHGYGRMILYPWGHTDQPVPNEAEYRRVGALMRDAMDVSYRLMSSSDLYPTSGTSEDIHQANGIFSITLEIGRSFQPDPSEIPVIAERVAKANMVFLDQVTDRYYSRPEAPEREWRIAS